MFLITCAVEDWKALNKLHKMSASFCVCVEAFNTAQVVSLLQNVLEEGMTIIPPAKLKAAEVYIYKYEDKSKKGIAA